MALTVAELEAVLKFKDEASAQIAQMRKELDKLSADAKKSSDFLGGLSGVAKQMGSALVAAFSIGAIKGAIGDLTKYAGTISDMSARTTIAKSVLQEFDFAGRQVGVSLGAITGAIEQMQNRLASGDKNAVDALKFLKVGFNDLRTMKPEDQFTTIANKIADIQDPAARTKLAMDIMGRGAMEIMPLLVADIDALSEKARELGVVLDDETIDNLDEMGDSLDSLAAIGQAVLADLLKPFVPLATAAAQAAMGFGGIVGELQIAFEQLIAEGARALRWLVDFGIKSMEVSRALNPFGTGVAYIDEQLAILRETSKQLDYVYKDLGQTQTKTTGTTKDALAVWTDASKATKTLNVDFDSQRKALKEAEDQIKKNNRQVDALRDTLRDLSDMIRGAERAGIPLTLQMEMFGKQAQDAALEATALGVAIPAAVDKAARAFAAAELVKVMTEIHQQTAALAKTNYDDFVKANQRIADVINDSVLVAMRAQKDFEVLLTDSMRTEVDRRISELEREKKAAIEKLGERVAANAPQWDAAKAQITAYYQHEIDKQKGTYGTLQERMREHGVKTKSELDEVAARAKTDYDQMQESGEYTMAQLSAARQRWLDAEKEASGQVTAVWLRTVDVIGESLSTMGNTVGGTFGGIVEAVTKGIDILKQFDAAQKQVASGKSAQDWAQMAAGFTNAASAMVTGFMMLAEAIDKSQHNALVEKMMVNTGRRYGFQLTRGMAEALVADIRLGENLGDLILRNLDEVLADQGGATKRNYENFARILLDAMNEAPPGGNKDRAWITRHLAEIEDTMNTVFPQLAQVVIDSNTFAGESFLELIRRENELGINTVAVTEFMRDRMSVAADGLKTFVENAAVTSQAAADGMVGAVVAMFDTMIQRGVPMTEILKQLDPVIVKLQEQFTAAGLSGGDAFAEVTRLATLARDEVAGPALTAVGGLNQALIAMQQSGMLNQQTFEGLARQVADTFNSLVAQGKSGDDILRLMQPTLQTIWELQQEFGYAVDEATQNLIDQAVEAGVVGDTHRDAQEKIAAAMQHVADTLDAIAIALGAIAPAAEDAAEGVEDAVRRLPTHIEIPVDFPTRGGPEFPVPVPADPENSFATGTGGFRDFGRGTWAMLHGKEKVVPASGPGSESGGETSREMRELYHLLKSLPTQVTMGVRGGINRSRGTVR